MYVSANNIHESKAVPIHKTVRARDLDIGAATNESHRIQTPCIQLPRFFSLRGVQAEELQKLTQESK